MSVEYRFIQAVDTVTIRGNKLFGDAGSYGETTFPPRPSVLSGAFRSLLWANNGRDAQAIQQSDFRLTGLFPASQNETGVIEVFLPLPADVTVLEKDKSIQQLEPQVLNNTIQHSQMAQLPMMPILRQGRQSKAESGWLLNQSGISAYLQGQTLSSTHIHPQADLWISESRIGIGLNRRSRTVDEGKLFTVEHTALQQNENSGITAGLIVGVSGCDTLPESGFIRLGGDGRAARFSAVSAPVFSPANINGKFKLVLLTPGLFAQGWLPDGIQQEGDHYWLKLDGFKARLACASISRAEIISGWDLEQWQPKAAERVVPSGSVYWFDQVQDDTAALDKLATEGWWTDTLDNATQSRRAEGYNRVLLAAW
ncbi:MAG TPA: type III-B CRISPR module-associated Cmr3 family protein [Thiolinea sp.]|nr:type III-B CRISPR module-associated Cmr3 family protein [Thiolinea sp.]